MRTNVKFDDFGAIFFLVDDFDVVDLLEFEDAIVTVETCFHGSRDGFPR